MDSSSHGYRPMKRKAAALLDDAVPFGPQSSASRSWTEILDRAALIASTGSHQLSMPEAYKSEDLETSFNKTFQPILKTSGSHLPSSLHDEHVIITGILLSFAAISAREPMNEQWQALSTLDNFKNSVGHDQATRTAMMWHMRSLWRYKSHPDPDPGHRQNNSLVPAWALPRPSQKYIRHADLIDFMFWPGIRERMCWQPDIYMTNNFLDLIARSWQVAWPHSFDKAYEYNPSTMLMQFTPEYRRVTSDVNSYKCKTVFFDQYPECRADIPPWDLRIPQQVQDPQTLRAGWFANNADRQRNDDAPASTFVKPLMIQEMSYQRNLEDLRLFLAQHATGKSEGSAPRLTWSSR